MRRHLTIDALEHVTRRRLAAGMQRAVALGLPLRRDHRFEDFRLGLGVALVRPNAALDEMVLQPDDGIAERPGVGFGLRPVGRRIVGA
jgi:hypothetical protein